MSTFEAISKVDIAVRQLDTAISLYLDGCDLVSATTLAGAAEEILGKLVRSDDKEAAFDKVITRLCQMHEAAFEEKASSKAYEAIRNRARNEFKHLCDGEDFNVNLEREASQMIRRAIENFKALNPGYYPRFKEFANVWLERNQ